MSCAANAMKAAHDNMDIDKVDELMHDIADQQGLAEEISTAISKPVGFGEKFDEDELMVELRTRTGGTRQEFAGNQWTRNSPSTTCSLYSPTIKTPAREAEAEESLQSGRWRLQ
uniref:Uncharacterized protein n=1 Tax=Piliocolobus tephrosceles TaxID=591936 RepID=A0A8C9GMZ8_9PRIM